MLNAVFLCGLVGAFAASAVADDPVVQSSCAATLCIRGTTCKEVYYPSEAVIRAVCFVSRPTGNENVCSNGQPLYVNSSRRGIVEANCGESLEAISCPSGYVCKSDPADAYAVCCPVPEFRPSTPTPEKPGECSAPGSLSCLRVKNCVDDRSCSGNQKCCKNRCGGYNCVSPVRPAPSCQTTKCPRNQRCVMEVVLCKTNPCPPRPRCVPLSVPVEKPGQCPAEAPGSVGICAFTCSSDGDCAGDSKCCRTPCGGTTCQSPAVEQRPSCNTVKCSAGYTCVMELPANCIFRKPCFEEPKCVPNEKEGACPRLSTLNSTLSRPRVCPRDCANDADCSQFQKCCAVPNGCGTLCQDPEPTNTCANVKCRAGQVCVMQEVQCIRAPCFPVPQCVQAVPTCPAFPLFVDPNCKRVDACSLDGTRRCPAGLLCCTTPCGHSCLRPV